MTAPGISVSGGAGGIEADLADLATLARGSTGLAEELALTSARCHPVLVDPDLLASALLDPAGVARFEAALLEALDGPRGLTVLAARFAARAVGLQAAAGAYEAADRALAELADDLEWATGFLWPATVAVLVVGGVARVVTDPAGAAVDVAVLRADPERWLTEHPGLVDDVMGALPGVGSHLGVLTAGLTAGWLGGGDVGAAARRLGRLWPDGSPVVTPLPDEAFGPGVVPPRGIDDLLASLEARALRSGAGRDTIAVRVVTHADGSTAYVVDIPGTADWNAPFGPVNPETHDLGTNVRVLGGEATTRQRAIAEALRRAGAGPADPVMLVGHSQGGMVAAQAAADAGTADFDFDVRSVVTAGSPIARAEVPPSVQVLALENVHDVVPQLDSRANDDSPNVTTVTFAGQHGSIGDNHGIGSAYRPAARAVDAADEPSLAAFRAAAAPFLVRPGEQATVVAHVYELGRR
ncbi:PGAP1-like alpha/beta domain-containing protein [Blastococcus sp. SYSU DS0619]